MPPKTLSIEPLSLPFDIDLPMPGSKSHANRAIILACLTPGKTTITNATPCDDVALLVKNLMAMGFAIRWVDERKGTLEVTGGFPNPNPNPNPTTLFCENAGTTLRFLTSLACLTPGNWIITGSPRMQQRPIGDLTKALHTLGADIRDTNGCPPLHIRGGTLQGGTVVLDASKSSQFLTSLLLIGPVLPRGLIITLPSPATSPTYIDLTEQVLRDVGVRIKRSALRYEVTPQTPRSPGTYAIEGDWSAAGAYLVLAEMTGSRFTSSTLSMQSKQGDRQIIDHIRALRGNANRMIDCTNTPDQVMNLAVLAARRHGKTTITGAANLRLKECDRLAVITEQLRKAGVRIDEHPDGIILHGHTKLRRATLDPSGDHRMAMAYAVLGSLQSGIRVTDPGCVSKSYPHFFSDLQLLHTSPRCLAIVGMRGCGKSNLGKRLASKLKLTFVDTDAVFKKTHGEIGAYVKRNGWPAFRAEEERIVDNSLKPGHVVSLGGGAIESEKTRELLQREALTIWMQVTAKTITERLKKLKRPALTNMPLEKEVPMVLKKRTPLYKEVAEIVLPPHINFAKQRGYILSQLEERCSW